MSAVTCTKCGQRVPAQWPPEGDGSVVLAWEHRNQSGSPCPGAGVEHDVGSDDVDVRYLIINPATAQPADGYTGNVLSPRRRNRRPSIVDRRMREGTLYQLEMKTCGRRWPAKGRPGGCKCKSEDPKDWHGPYWIAYTTNQKRGGKVVTAGDAPGAGGWKKRKMVAADWEFLNATPPTRTKNK